MRRLTAQGAHVSYSGGSEDTVMMMAFKRRTKNPPYIEVGAHHPTIGSNTYAFYLGGSRGLCVEPNEALIPELRRIRPEDTIVCAAVGAEKGTAEFTIMADPSRSTLEDVAEGIRTGVHSTTMVAPRKKIQVDVITLEDCIKMLGKVPDFISLDTEGTDEAILRSFDFKKYRPYL